MRPSQPPVGLELARTARTVSRAFDDALSEAGGSLPVWLVPLAVKTRNPARQREPAVAFGTREAALTPHPNRRETGRPSTRPRHPPKRRLHNVERTPAG